MRLAPMLIFIALCACGSPSAVAPLAKATAETPGLVVQSVNAKQTQSAAIYQATQSAVDVQNANARIADATARAEATFSAHSWSITRTVDAMMIAQMQYSATVQAQSTQVFQTQSAESRMIADGQERARATATAEAIERNARTEADWEETGRLLKGALVFTAFVGGLTAVVVIAIMLHSTLAQLRDISLDYFKAQADIKQAEADRARIIWRIVEERGKRIEIGWFTPPNGAPPYRLLPEAHIVDAEPADKFDDVRKVEAWKQAVLRFTTFSGDGSYSHARLGSQGMGIVNRRAWDVLTGYMVDNGYLTSLGESSKTRWAGEWNKRKFQEAVHAGEVKPFPIADDYVPVVNSPLAQFTEKHS